MLRMHDTQKRSISRARAHKVTIAFFVIIIASLSLIVWHRYTHRYIAGKITFQQYEPAYWPSERTVKQRTINAVYVPSASPARYTELVLEMSDGSVVSERERKKSSLISECPAGSIANQTCRLGRTSKGETYLIFTTTYESGGIDQRIEWSRQDTDIGIQFKAVPEGGYSEEQIERIIQSFKPIQYTGLEVRYIDRSVI